jgi:hypothetical protein
MLFRRLRIYVICCMCGCIYRRVDVQVDLYCIALSVKYYWNSQFNKNWTSNKDAFSLNWETGTV